MKRLTSLLLLPATFHVAHAQFVYPRSEYHDQKPGIYKEDPFISHYRQEFFAVFQGDFPRFEKAYKEIKAMVAKNPKDARALIWLGNGQTVEAGVLRMKGQAKQAADLLVLSRKTMDEAVALRPKDPNIYMMQAATLYVQGQYWGKAVPKSGWEELRDDCLKLIAYLGPKMAKMSVHVRGEAYGELGIAYKNLGDKNKAADAFRKIIALDPKTDYSARAEKELHALGEVARK